MIRSRTVMRDVEQAGGWMVSRMREVLLVGALFVSVDLGAQTIPDLKQPPAPPAPQQRPGYVPPAGFVPRAEVAIRIAEAVLIPIYGEQNIRGQMPLTAVLEGDVWIVTGTLPPDTAGGVARIEIRKRDGQIIHLSHGR
jgi:hypothetical protein